MAADSGRSWAVAGACCLANCLLYGVARLSGLLMVAALEAFPGAGRARAALPFSVATSARNLSGVFVGHLGRRFGVGRVVCGGCLLASLGAGLCFFARDILCLTVCWGGLFGIGYGLATCLLPHAINQHFVKHCGTASGISYSGSYIGSFIFPPLVVILLNNYGLPGTFLIISGTVLNVLAASMILVDPKRQKTAQPPTKVPAICDAKNRETSAVEDRDSWLQRWRYRCAAARTRQMAKPTVASSVSLTSSVTFDQDSHPVVGFRGKSDSVSSKTSALFLPAPPNSVPKSYLRTSLSKGKSRSKYMAKLSRLKQMVSVSLFTKKYSLKPDLPPMQNENIRLVSFRKLHCILCPRMCSPHPSSGGDASARVSDFYGNPIRIHPRQSFLPEPSNDGDASARVSDFYGNPIRIHPRQSFPHPSNDGDASARVSDSHGNPRTSSSGGGGAAASSCRRLSRRGKRPDREAPRPSSLRGSGRRSSRGRGSSSSFFPPVAGSFCAEWARLLGRPMFVVISLTMSLYSFVMVCLITVLEDFAKDLRIPEGDVHYVLMVLSAADLVGTLTLGLVTDRGYMSRRHFIALCFAGMGVCSGSLSLCRGPGALLGCVACYGLFEAGTVITFPVLMGRSVPPRAQAVAVAASNVLSAPTVLLVPPVIGHFRDHLGCYSGVFYLLGVTSLMCACLWLMVPLLQRALKREIRDIRRLSMPH